MRHLSAPKTQAHCSSEGDQHRRPADLATESKRSSVGLWGWLCQGTLYATLLATTTSPGCSGSAAPEPSSSSTSPTVPDASHMSSGGQTGPGQTGPGHDSSGGSGGSGMEPVGMDSGGGTGPVGGHDGYAGTSGQGSMGMASSGGPSMGHDNDDDDDENDEMGYASSGGSSEPLGFNSGQGSGAAQPLGSSGGSFPGSSGSGGNSGSSMLGGLLGMDPAKLARALDAKPPQKQRFPSDFGTQSELAFKQGYEKLADRLLMAHLALEPELSAEKGSYEKVRMSSMLRKPIWNLRWGMAIALKTPDDFDGNVSPITADTRGGDGSGFGPGSAGGLGIPGGPVGGGSNNGQQGPVTIGSDAVKDIPELLGLFGDVSAEMFRKRFANGDYGVVFSSMAGTAKPLPRAAGGNAGGMMGMDDDDDGEGRLGPPGLSGPGMGGMGQAPGAPGMDGPGSSGPGLMGLGTGGAPSGMGGGGGRQEENAGYAAFNQLEPARPRWQPGIVYLGQQSINSVVAVAKTAGVDAILFFDVSVENRRSRDGRTSEVENTTRARIILVSNPKQTFSSAKKLSTSDVKSRNSNGQADPTKMVEEALEPMFADVDRKLMVTELPSLTAKNASDRIATLLADSTADPIAIMAEVQLYRFKGLLTDEDVLIASELLFGDDGIKLIAAADGIRRDVAESLQKPISDYSEIGLPDPNRNSGQGGNAGGGFAGFGGGANTPFGGAGAGMSGGFDSEDDDDAAGLMTPGGNGAGLMNSGGGGVTPPPLNPRGGQPGVGPGFSGGTGAVGGIN